MFATDLEETYQRYRYLRKVALSVYAKKIEEYEKPDYEKLCTIVLFEFDGHNQKQVAQKLGISHSQLCKDLARLSTGARLFKQDK